MNDKVRKIRNNPELIVDYLIEEEDKDVLREQGYQNFVDNCDDAEILFIVQRFEKAQDLNKVAEQLISKEED